MKKILMSVACAIFVSSNCVWPEAAQTRLTADQVLSIAATGVIGGMIGWVSAVSAM